MSLTQIRCPGCRVSLKCQTVPPPNKKARCPRCGARFSIPLDYSADEVGGENAAKELPLQGDFLPASQAACGSQQMGYLASEMMAQARAFVLPLVKRFVSEVRETARATARHMVRLFRYAQARLETRRLSREAVEAQLALGQRMWELGLGEEELRKQIAQLEERIRNLESGRRPSHVLLGECRELKSRLAQPALAQLQPVPGTEAEYEAASAARRSLITHQDRVAGARNSLLPSSREDLIRTGIGHAVAAMVLVALVLVCWSPRSAPDVVAKTSPEVEACIRRGKDFMDQLEFHRAAGEFTRAIQLDPRYVGAYVARAGAHNALGDHDAAMRDAVEAVHADKNYAPVSILSSSAPWSQNCTFLKKL